MRVLRWACTDQRTAMAITDPQALRQLYAGPQARDDIRRCAYGIFDRVLLIPEPFLAALGYRDDAAERAGALGNLGDDTGDGGDGADLVRGGQGNDVLRGGAVRPRCSRRQPPSQRR